MAGELNGKVVLITGATQGLGLSTALALAPMGGTLVLVGRDETRLEAAKQRVQAAGASAPVETLRADLSSLSEVRDLAARFKARFPRLDVLVNNAGAVFMQREHTVDGLEKTFALNHLAYFQLTWLLLDLLKASAPARVINLSSSAANGGKIDFEDLMAERSYRGLRTYCNSKLANMYFTQELARRLEGTGVTVNAVHPGLVTSGFGKNTPGWLNRFVTVFAGVMLSPEKGARTTVKLASSPEVQGVTGRYFIRSKARSWPRNARSPEVARRLWDVSAKLTGVLAPR